MCLSSLETQSILCKVTCHIKEVLIAFAGVVNLNRKSFHHQVLFYLILGILLSILCHVEQIKVWTLQELRMLCPRHNVNVNIVVLNCQKCNKRLKCQVSGHKSLGSFFERHVMSPHHSVTLIRCLTVMVIIVLIIIIVPVDIIVPIQWGSLYSLS